MAAIPPLGKQSIVLPAGRMLPFRDCTSSDLAEGEHSMMDE
jgi:hypothetical protein